jgi:hypothetical protein
VAQREALSPGFRASLFDMASERLEQLSQPCGHLPDSGKTARAEGFELRAIYFIQRILRRERVEMAPGRLAERYEFEIYKGEAWIIAIFTSDSV